MTARTRKGYKGHGTHGADKGRPHAKLMAQHTMGARPEGAMMGAPQTAAPPMMSAPPDAGGAAMAGPPPMSDDTEGSQS